jgi:hypothetical protein
LGLLHADPSSGNRAGSTGLGVAAALPGSAAVVVVVVVVVVIVVAVVIIVASVGSHAATGL